ncbi:MAG TPA: hypothetical protein PKG98_02615 [Myxococcota bacterium]|nr:hypothetical protein [Myxococcota bacterium]
MDLLCLNCGGEFEVDASAVGSDGATVKCVHCGLEQSLYVRRRTAGLTESGEFRMSVDLMSSADRMVAGEATSKPVVRETVGAFKKPMSSSWVEKMSPDSPQASEGRQAAIDAVPQVPGDDQIDPESFFVPDLAASIPGIGAAEAGLLGPFVVRSPAALVLEFPDFQVLEEWARSIEKPEKYSVQNQSGAESTLCDFLRDRKPGPSRAGAIRNAMRAAGIEAGGDPGSFSGQLRQAEARGQGGTGGDSSVSRQFQFKIEETRKRSPRRVVLTVVMAIAVVGIILGALFLLEVI